MSVTPSNMSIKCIFLKRKALFTCMQHASTIRLQIYNFAKLIGDILFTTYTVLRDHMDNKGMLVFAYGLAKDAFIVNWRSMCPLKVDFK